MTLLSLANYNDSQHWPKVLKHYSLLSFYTCNAKLVRCTAFSTGYFVDVCLAIKVQTNCSEFALVFGCTAQLVVVVNYRKFFPTDHP